MDEQRRLAKLAAARAKYGHLYRCDVKSERQTKPSHLLLEIEQRQAEMAQPGNVTQMRGKKV